MVAHQTQLTTDVLFIEAIDCFCANLPLSVGHIELAKDIGKHVSFSQTEVSGVSLVISLVHQIINFHNNLQGLLFVQYLCVFYRFSVYLDSLCISLIFPPSLS